MARSRNIKPGFFQNELLVEVPPLGRLLFAGLWTIADRAGRLEDRPRRIKASLLPYDDCDTDELLQQLATRSFITRYNTDGNAFIEITNFSKHQNPHCKEAHSTIPAPEAHSANPMLEHDKQGSSPADSFNLIPDFFNPKPIPPLVSAPADEDFEKFWAFYPKKVAKQDALKAWRKLKPDNDLRERIFKSIERHKQSRQWLEEGGKYVPYPASWLNGQRWEDDPEFVLLGDQNLDGFGEMI